MPVALCAGMIVTMMMIVIGGVVIVTMTIAMAMIANFVMVTINALGSLSTKRAALDVDMRNAVAGMGVPQTVADARCGPRIKHQTVPGIENAERSLPAKALLPGRSHLRLPNDEHPDI